MKQYRCSRRRLLERAALLGAGAGLPMVLRSSVAGAGGRASPSNRIALGCIGIGGEGTRNLTSYLGQPDAQVRIVCDVDPAHRLQARDLVNRQYQNSDCAACSDFREVLARSDLDAVCISTPDHWHVPMSLMAIRAGKDVVCEKPTLTIAEGRVLSDVVSQYGAVFQTSTEDRSLFVYHRMAELVRNGRIGRLQRIHVTLPAGPMDPGDPAPQPVPKGFDYQMWLGPAPWAPYCPGRIHWNFRWITDYSGGQLTDWGAHLIDTAQWANDTEHSGPIAAEGSGKRHAKGLYNTFYEYRLRYEYANGVEMFVKSGGVALRFEGTDGWVGNDGWTAPLQSSSKAILDSVIGPEGIHLYTCRAGEQRNFLDCVKSRKDPYFPAEIGHRCSSVMHIGNIAMELGRKLRWDPKRERFPDDDTANRMLSRAMREPWTL
jgi:myo-inositol 2-dehydrogenase / D-chiro-inositol 1-dehydrogenase